MKNLISIGIDPEPSGALVLIRLNPDLKLLNLIYIDTSPKNRKEATVLLYKSLGNPIIIEQQWGRPGGNPVAISKLMLSYGWWLGTMDALKIPYLITAPTRWKNFYGLREGKKKKQASHRVAKSITKRLNFPPLDGLLGTGVIGPRGGKFKRFYDRVEAFLMALYGLSNYPKLHKIIKESI